MEIRNTLKYVLVTMGMVCIALSCREDDDVGPFIPQGPVAPADIEEKQEDDTIRAPAKGWELVLEI